MEKKTGTRSQVVVGSVVSAYDELGETEEDLESNQEINERTVQKQGEAAQASYSSNTGEVGEGAIGGRHGGAS